MAVSKTAHLGSNPGGPVIRFQQQLSLSPPKIRGYSLIGRAARENLEDIGSSPF